MLIQRGVNLASMTTWNIPDEQVCRVQLLVEVPDLKALEMLRKRLDRLINVLKVVPLDDKDTLCRKAVLVRVAASTEARGHLADIARLFGAEVVDISLSSVTVYFAGEPARVADLLAVLIPFGVGEVIESGTVGIARGCRNVQVPLALRSISA
jgi:acetolactate synthase-1/3 small subunit